MDVLASAGTCQTKAPGEQVQGVGRAGQITRRVWASPRSFGMSPILPTETATCLPSSPPGSRFSSRVGLSSNPCQQASKFPRHASETQSPFSRSAKTSKDIRASRRIQHCRSTRSTRSTPEHCEELRCTSSRGHCASSAGALCRTCSQPAGELPHQQHHNNFPHPPPPASPRPPPTTVIRPQLPASPEALCRNTDLVAIAVVSLYAFDRRIRSLSAATTDARSRMSELLLSN